MVKDGYHTASNLRVCEVHVDQKTVGNVKPIGMTQQTHDCFST